MLNRYSLRHLLHRMEHPLTTQPAHVANTRVRLFAACAMVSHAVVQGSAGITFVAKRPGIKGNQCGRETGFLPAVLSQTTWSMCTLRSVSKFRQALPSYPRCFQLGVVSTNETHHPVSKLEDLFTLDSVDCNRAIGESDPRLHRGSTVVLLNSHLADLVNRRCEHHPGGLLYPRSTVL